MPEDLRNRVVAATRKVLRPGGSLLIYQFSPAVRASLEPVFDDVRHEFEWLNILPAHVFRCHVAHGHGTNGHGKGNGTHH
jgi:phospholipid N-methyltransferase